MHKKQILSVCETAIVICLAVLAPSVSSSEPILKPYSTGRIAANYVDSSVAYGISRPFPLNTIIDEKRGKVILSTLTVSPSVDLVYEFVLDRNGEYIFPRFRIGSILDSLVFATFDSIRPGITYAWRCRAVSVSRDDSSNWSVITIFDMEHGVRSRRGMTDCLWPAQGTALQSNGPTFSIRDLADIDSLCIHVAGDPDFEEIIESCSIQTGNGHPAYWRMSKTLPGTGNYYWRISSDGVTWTEPISFAVDIDVHPVHRCFGPFEKTDRRYF
jgi:hypothetical protein